MSDLLPDQLEPIADVERCSRVEPWGRCAYTAVWRDEIDVWLCDGCWDDWWRSVEADREVKRLKEV